MTRRTILCPDVSDHSLAVSGPVDFFESISIPTFSEMQRELFRALWDEIHTRDNPDAEWFATWRARVPSFSGCGCGEFLDDYCVTHPPRFDDFPRWSWELHNAVNAKLGRPSFAWIDFVIKYRPDKVPFEWRSVTGVRVGFIAIVFSAIGGTETFAATLLPRLPNVIGCAIESMIVGDVATLGVPAYEGSDAIRSLCSQSDVIVSWLVNPRDYGFKGRVIMIHHGSPVDESQTQASLQGDEIVCVSRETAAHIRTLTNKPVHWIPNAVDRSRLVARTAMELPPKKLCVWIHRFAADKRPELAVAIAHHLPPDWQLVMAGDNGSGLKLATNDRVTILPPQWPGDLLCRASCFLSTSKFDGFGLSVAEAIAAGVPVVSSPAGIATEPGLATIVPHDADPAAWAEAIVATAQTSTRPDLPIEYELETHVARWADLLRFPGNNYSLGG
jgi:glycosyltransferase involved in cell wall biosynthesis